MFINPIVAMIYMTAVMFCSNDKDRVEAVAKLHSPPWSVSNDRLKDETGKPIATIWCTEMEYPMDPKPCVGDPATECALQY